MKYPNDANGAVLQSMVDAGMDLSQEHEIEFCHEWHCRNSYFRLPARTLVWGGGDHCSMIGPARGGLVVNEPSLV